MTTLVPLRNKAARDVPRRTNTKILFVLPKASEFGGLERHLLDLLRRLPDTLVPAIVVCFVYDVITPRMDQEQREKVIVKCLTEPRSLWDWIRIIREEYPNVVVFPYNWIEAFPWQVPVAAVLAGVRRRVSIQHSMPPPLPSPVEGKPPSNLLRRLVGRRARNVLKVKISAKLSGCLSSTTVCVSKAVREALVETYGYKPRKTIVVVNGVSSSIFTPSPTAGATVRARLGIGADEFVLVCAARLANDKGIDILIRAVAQAVNQGVPNKCIILGDGPLREKLQQKAEAEGLKDHIFFEGFQADVRPYLQAGSAFILTSRLEGLPISVLEAMACGLPCIVTNVGGSAEAVKNQVTGLVIPPESVNAAADAIVYLATNPDKRSHMASEARAEVGRSFDLDQRMAELISLIIR